MQQQSIQTSTIKLLMAYALFLGVFYLSTLEGQQLAIGISMATGVFLLDMLILHKITTGLKDKLANAACVESALLQRLQSTVKPNWLLQLLKQDILVVFYAGFARHFTPVSGDNLSSFSYHKASNSKDVFWLVVICQLPTLPFIHFFIEHQGNALAAWFVTVITLWSVVYFYAQQHAIRFRPVKVTDSSLEYRFGLSWQASIALDNIKSVQIAGGAQSTDYFEFFISPFGSDKNLIIEFYQPVKFRGLYFTTKRRNKAIIAVDEPGALQAALTGRNSNSNC